MSIIQPYSINKAFKRLQGSLVFPRTSTKLQYSQQCSLSWVLLKKLPWHLLIWYPEMSTGGAWNLDEDLLPPPRQGEQIPHTELALHKLRSKQGLCPVQSLLFEWQLQKSSSSAAWAISCGCWLCRANLGRTAKLTGLLGRVRKHEELLFPTSHRISTQPGSQRRC